MTDISTTDSTLKPLKWKKISRGPETNFPGNFKTQISREISRPDFPEGYTILESQEGTYSGQFPIFNRMKPFEEAH